MADETFTASFIAASANLAVGAPQSPPGYYNYRVHFENSGPHCKGSGGTTLDAGALVVTAASGAATIVPPVTAQEETTYKTRLPAGTIQTGSVKVDGKGGVDIGAFQAMLSFPPDIQITTPLSPGTIIPFSKPFTITWKNAGADDIVRVRLGGPDASWSQYAEYTARGSDGGATLQTLPVNNTAQLPVGPGDNVRVVVLVSPSTPVTFAAPGLTTAGTADWTYEYQFLKAA